MIPGDGDQAVGEGAGIRSWGLRPVRARRLTALGVLAAVVAAGLAVHTLLPDVAATDIAGDALYAAAVYLAIALIAPRLRPLAVGSVAGAWCVVVELFQLTGIPLAVGTVFAPAMLVLGTVFDARDLVVYLATIAVITGIEALAGVLAAGRRM